MKKIVNLLFLFFWIVTWHLDGHRHRWQTDSRADMESFVENLKAVGAEKIIVFEKN